MKIHNINPHKNFIFSVDHGAEHAVLHLQKRGPSDSPKRVLTLRRQTRPTLRDPCHF